MKLGISFCSTKMYLYAANEAVRRIIAAASYHEDVVFIYISDSSKECGHMGEWIKKELPEGWSFEHRAIKFDLDAAQDKYKVPSQLIISAMQGEAFAVARKLRVDFLWNVEADVLVPADALRVLQWTLALPNADGSPYYDVAIVTYPNGLFIGGFGDPAHPIAEDYLPSERVLPEELLKRLEIMREEENAFIKEKKRPEEDWQKKSAALMEEVRKCPPDGNIFAVTSKYGWRRRGWMDHAYPGIGRGAVVPVDWIGTGCVLLSAKALALATFEGYGGQGTQDLFLCWRNWAPAGLRFACVTHTACSHVKREIIDGKESFHLLEASHEQMGEQRGHLRVMRKDWKK